MRLCIDAIGDMNRDSNLHKLGMMFLGGWWLLLLSLSTAEPAIADDSQNSQEKSKVEDHWGEGSVGFRWVENDGHDARWNQMDTGPMMTSSLDVPGGDGKTTIVSKALSIRLGDRQNAAVCFDLERMTVRCGWVGGFLEYDPIRFGLVNRPKIAGKTLFTSPPSTGWGNAEVNYRGSYLHGSRVVLSYDVDAVPVLDSFWAHSAEDSTSIVRFMEIAPHPESLTVIVADSGTPLVVKGDSQFYQVLKSDSKPTSIRILPSAKPLRFEIWIGPPKTTEAIKIAGKKYRSDLSALTKPGPLRWGEPLMTRGEVGESDQPLVIDSVELPFENRFGALLFVGGHDFFSTPGKMAICTVHGDVWIVSGIDDTLDKIEWRRFATGLFQPLGLRIVDDLVYVLGRDQITRLIDLNKDGEADFYESFNNDGETSPEGHDFSTCLQTDAQGNFYYLSEKGVHRVSPDGKEYETIATGLRNPNGLAVAEDGTTIASPQEGTWTPASAIVEVTPGGYYGFGGPRVTPERPRGYDPPLCWIPRLIDNSTGGQVWVTGDVWQPLEGQLLNMSYGQCRLLLTLLEPRTWSVPPNWPVLGDVNQVTLGTVFISSAAQYVQGGSLSLPLSFQSGIMRGRFSPHDGQLYVSGLRGWVSTAVQDGCLQRVRYTGKSFPYPNGVRTLANGLAISFAISLEKEEAENPGNYQLQKWNYKYSGNYGSPEYKVSDPRFEGRDEVEILSASLLDDQTVFLEIADVQPAMQFSVGYALRGTDGQALRNVYYHTINSVPDVRLDPAHLTRSVRANQLAVDEIKQLQPGLLWRFAQSNGERDGHDARSDRGAALYVPEGACVTPFLQPGPFQAVAEGYLRVRLPGVYHFSLVGQGSARISLNHKEALSAEGVDLSKTSPQAVALKGGYNHLKLEYDAPNSGDASVRLLWSSDDFARELVPPDSLLHPSQDKALVASQQLRAGRTLFAELRCFRCHSKTYSTKVGDHSMPELAIDAPNLTTIGDRLRPEWIARWLLDPASQQSNARMPRMFGTSRTDRQQALDVATYLASKTSSDEIELNSFEAKLNADSLIEAGEIVFTDLGCLICHCLTTDDEPEEFARMSLASVQQKYRKGALASFLKKPHQHYVSSRMPDFQLSDEEVAALVAFLEDATTDTINSFPVGGNAARGRQIFASKGCGACHQLEDPRLSPFPKAPEIRRRPSSRGCLDHELNSEHNGPVYVLTSDERDSLRVFLQQDRESLTRYSSIETSERLIKRYDCLACHDRDSFQSNRGIIMAEEGRGLAPESIPSLTWTGEKLLAPWTAKFLAGQRDRSLRPWLRTRMPCVPQFADVLAEGFAHQHGIPTTSPKKPNYDAKLAEIGRQLTLQTALDCRQCHGIGKLNPRGDDHTKLAPGINFTTVRERLHQDYYMRFVLNPPRFDFSTKMPQLARDGRTTAAIRFYDGDAEKQFHAVWHYLQHYNKHANSADSQEYNRTDYNTLRSE
ncbi:DUF6797 domain-containing protein [Bythopirellula polymerisocia]|nr:DUF6797 domain-containing protein [Bythopirellula polymerisocia]